MKPTYKQLWEEREALTEQVSLLQMRSGFLLEMLEMYQDAIREFIEASGSESSWLPAFEKLEQISRKP